jgi:hypothetical protein
MDEREWNKHGLVGFQNKSLHVDILLALEGKNKWRRRKENITQKEKE